MRRIRNILRIIGSQWDRFWFGPYDPTILPYFRIALGLLYLVMLCFLAPNWTDYFSRDGIPNLGPPDGYHAFEDWWCVFGWFEPRVPIGFYWWLGILASVTFIAGFFTRLSTVILFVLQTSLIHRNIYVVNGEDLVLRLAFFYCLFAPLNHSLSVDRWLFKSSPGPAAVWPIRLLQINTLLIYGFSLPLKLIREVAWRTGDAFYYVMINRTWSRWPWPEIFYEPTPSLILTYATILIEGLFPILCWWKPTRTISTCMVMAFHVLIAICLKNVTFFSLSMVVVFIVFLPPPHYLRFPAFIVHFRNSAYQFFGLRSDFQTA